MALVGPRPLTPDEDRWIAADSCAALRAPGMTGLWQALGGNDIGFDDMVVLDETYVLHRSSTLDRRLLAATGPQRAPSGLALMAER